MGLLAFLVLAGCSPQMLSPAQVSWAKEGMAGPPLFARPQEHVGDRIILGGVILKVGARPGQATIRLLAYPLDKTFYPETGHPPLGPSTIFWSGPPLSTLFVSGNRIVVEGTVLHSDQKRTVFIRARVLSPDTCISSGGFACRRTRFGCTCKT